MIGNKNTIGEEIQIGTDYIKADQDSSSSLVPIVATIAVIVIIFLLAFTVFSTKYIVTFDSNGGTIVDEVKVNKGKTVKEPTPPTMEGYIFLGWYYNDELFDFETPITSDLYLIAMWSLDVVDPNKAIQIKLDQSEIYILIGKEDKLIATVTPNEVEDKSVTWTSSNPSIATVNESGVIKAISEGTVTITATTVTGDKTATCKVTVTKQAVAVTGVSIEVPKNEIAVNETIKLNPKVEPVQATNRTVTWSSSNNAVATVDNNGNVTGRGSGTAIITVRTEDGGKTATASITVAVVPVASVSLSSSTINVGVGQTNNTLRAIILPNNATNRAVTWSSGNTGIATVDNNGVVRGVSEGSTTITVTTVDGSKTASATVTVSNISVSSVSCSPGTRSIEVGATYNLTATISPANATNKNITWSSGNTGIATVVDGLVRGISAGTTTITVTTADGSKTADCSVTVTNPVVRYCYTVSEIPKEAPTDPVQYYAIVVTANGTNISNNSQVTSLNGNFAILAPQSGRFVINETQRAQLGSGYINITHNGTTINNITTSCINVQ